MEEKKCDPSAFSSVTETWIGDLIGTPFIAKRGLTDREKEETNLTEEATLECMKEP
jgi:hypothetical protein